MLSYTWAGVVVGWSLIRALIVWAAVGDYGLNPWVYLAIDLVCAAVDGYTTPRMVLAFIDDHFGQAVKWAVISLGVFVVPDVYIFLGTNELPTHIIWIVCAVIALTFSLAVWSVVRKIKAGRAARLAGANVSPNGLACFNGDHEGSRPVPEPHRHDPPRG